MSLASCQTRPEPSRAVARDLLTVGVVSSRRGGSQASRLGPSIPEGVGPVPESETLEQRSQRFETDVLPYLDQLYAAGMRSSEPNTIRAPLSVSMYSRTRAISPSLSSKMKQ